MNHVILQVCYIAQVSIVVANTLIASFFKTLVDHEVTVELKNDISIRGTLKSVDQYLNIKLDDIQVVEELKYPHLVSPIYIYHITDVELYSVCGTTIGLWTE